MMMNKASLLLLVMCVSIASSLLIQKHFPLSHSHSLSQSLSLSHNPHQQLVIDVDSALCIESVSPSSPSLSVSPSVSPSVSSNAMQTVFSRIRRVFQSVINSVSRSKTTTKTMSREALALVRKHEQQQQEVNQDIDRFFEGSGIVGSWASSLLKSLSKSWLESLQRNQCDVESIQAEVTRRIEADATCRRVLRGRGKFQSSSPTSSSTSTVFINMEKTRQLTLTYHIIIDDSIVGEVYVRASSSPKMEILSISHLEITFQNGQKIDLSSAACGGPSSQSGMIIEVEHFVEEDSNIL